MKLLKTEELKIDEILKYEGSEVKEIGVNKADWDKSEISNILSAFWLSPEMERRLSEMEEYWTKKYQPFESKSTASMWLLALVSVILSVKTQNPSFLVSGLAILMMGSNFIMYGTDYIYKKGRRYEDALNKLGWMRNDCVDGIIRNLKVVLTDYSRFSGTSEILSEYSEIANAAEKKLVSILKGVINDIGDDRKVSDYGLVILSHLVDKTLNGENTKRLLSNIGKDDLVKLAKALVNAELSLEGKIPEYASEEGIKSIRTVYAKIIPSIANGEKRLIK